MQARSDFTQTPDKSGCRTNELVLIEAHEEIASREERAMRRDFHHASQSFFWVKERWRRKVAATRFRTRALHRSTFN
jgi:hypothetical protein